MNGEGVPVLTDRWADADVYAGALLDAGGRVRVWLDLVVQRRGVVLAGACRVEIDAEESDARWARLVAALDWDCDSLYRLGTENPSHSEGAMVTREPLHARPGETEFVLAADENAGSVGSTAGVFNACGGCLTARPSVARDLAAYASWLRGEGPRGGVCPGAGDTGEVGFLIGSRGGVSAGLESVYLRVRALAGAVRCVAGAQRALGVPLLGVSTDVFGYRMDSAPADMPRSWRSSIAFHRPPLAIGVFGDAGGGTFAERGVLRAASPFEPRVGAGVASGSGSVRVRRSDGGRVEATVVADVLHRSCPDDRIVLSLDTDRGLAVAVGHADRVGALAAGEWRFEGDLAAGSSVAGAGVHGSARVEVCPNATFAWDVHALGVVGLDLLCRHEGRSLVERADELRSLARVVMADAGEGGYRPVESLTGERVWAAARREPRFGEVLGPSIGSRFLPRGGDWREVVPEPAWWAIVAVLARWVISAEPGVAPGASGPRAGEAAIIEVEELTRRLLSLLLVDWSANREMAKVIRGMRRGY